MTPPKNILVPTDFSDQARAGLALAVELARRAGAVLHVLHVMDPLEGDYYSPLRYAPETEALHENPDTSVYELLQEAIKPFDTAGLRVELVKTRAAKVPKAIVHYAEQEGIDLIVMGTHGRGGVARFLLGSVASVVVRKAPCDVLTVRETSPPEALERILVPVDFSAYSPGLLHRAARLARLYGARLDVLHVIEPLAFPVSLTGIRTIYDLVPDLQEKVREHLLTLVKEEGLAEDAVEVHVTDGHPALAIASFAEAIGADLVCVARRGLGEAKRFLLGSVAERVMRIAPCPVLIARVQVDEAAEGNGNEQEAQVSASPDTGS